MQKVARFTDLNLQMASATQSMTCVQQAQLESLYKYYMVVPLHLFVLSPHLALPSCA